MNTIQNSGYVVPTIQTNDEGDYAMVGFDDFFDESENSEQKTQEAAQSIFSKGEVTELTKENNTLRYQLYVAKSDMTELRKKMIAALAAQKGALRGQEQLRAQLLAVKINVRSS